MNPKVFLSHASEDKDRFVLDFAIKLRGLGIDVWLDKWEMFPGDSLVDKIFEEGLKEADAVIIVLSHNSVDKPWVKEELNAGIMKRLSKGTKIIPVVIDDCKVPEALKSTLWEKIERLDEYPESLDRIVASVYGQTEKPPIGNAPSYVNSPIANIPGMAKSDNLVLKLSCEYAIKENDRILNPGKVFLENDSPIIPESELSESLEILDREGYIKLSRTIGAGLSHYQITTHGFEEYAEAYLQNYHELQTRIISLLVNENIASNVELVEKLNQSQLVIDHILDLLEKNGHVNLSKMIGGLIRVYNISPSLKRSLS